MLTPLILFLLPFCPLMLFEQQDMSARGYFRLLKLIRTIADINDRDEIKLSDIEEAVFFRNETQSKGEFV